MSAGAAAMVVVIGLTAGALGVLLFALARTIRNEHGGKGIWREFGLGIALMALFFLTWIGQAISQWQVFTDEQAAHGQEVAVGDFAAQFLASTLENWQSEFLQLFSFVVLAALFVFKGSAESKDADEKLEASLRRIEEKLNTLPESAPTATSQSWKLPDPTS